MLSPIIAPRFFAPQILGNRFSGARVRLRNPFQIFWILLVVAGWITGSERAFAQRPLGTDVSHYQPTINWTTLKNNGIVFAWCKATESTGYVDSSFTTHEANAKAAGVLIGAYHFARYDLNVGTNGAIAEANHFWSVAQNYIVAGGSYMMPTLDAEYITISGVTYNPTSFGYTKATYSQWCNAWCTTVSNNAAAAGVVIRPVIYSGVSFSASYLDSTVTNWYPWIANWPTTPDSQTGAPSGSGPWNGRWTAWQYADTNPYSNGDSDVFNGDYNSLVSTLVIGGSVTSPPFFISQPSSRTVDRGSFITMRTAAGGATNLYYQWRFKGANIASATNTTYAITNIQTTNGGGYTVVVTNSYGSVTSAVATLTVNALYTPVFSDNFDTNSSSSWTLNRSSTDTRAIFAYDYSLIGVPSAPNSTGSTKGLRMEANLASGVVAALNVSPIGQSFGGNYRLHFDMWINVNGPLPGGGTGSTEHLTAGVGTAGNNVQWNGAGSTADGAWFAVDGEGGVGDSSTTQSDWGAYLGTNNQASTTGVYLAGTATSARGNTAPYYANVFPGGEIPPAFQRTTYAQQTGSLAVGAVGFAWRDVVINKNSSTVEWFVDGLKIASVPTTSLTSSNIFIGYWDAFPSLSNNTNLSFGLVDNLRVEVPVTAPTIASQPQSLTVPQGSDATFAVTANGAPSPGYQWRFNGANIANATASNFTRTNAQPSDAGSYSVVVTNFAGSITSSVASLTITLPPTVTSQPVGQVVNVGANASFTVAASGSSPLSYQWNFNNTTIPGSTTPTLSLTNVQFSQAGNYSVVVTNSAGLVTSSNAALTVMQMQVASSGLNPDGTFQLTISGAPGSYTIDTSTNLVNWTPLTNLSNPGGTIQFTDLNSTNLSLRFYRVSAPK